ncbi:MAG: LURP-one-related family protein [Lachnospiraceae bacterium]|nr:LURP-one-related family protein [Lachnospiraceae bacterium]
MSVLYVKQKVMTVTEEFTVLDEKKKPKFFVKGNLLGKKKLSVFSDEKRKEEIAEIKEQHFLGDTVYDIHIHGKKVATMKAKKSKTKPEFKVTGLHWEIKGTLFEDDFKITKMLENIATIHKEKISMGDSYKVKIAKDENDLAAVLLVLAIDAAVFDE